MTMNDRQVVRWATSAERVAGFEYAVRRICAGEEAGVGVAISVSELDWHVC